MLHVLTYRPEFSPPWPQRSHMTPLTLNRLERPQVEAMIAHLGGGKVLPDEVVAHIVARTDGVPLYVEELTKMFLASDLLQAEAGAYVLTGPLATVAIPDTLQDSLMARLDQMNTAKEVAQLGAVVGREFEYEILQEVSAQDAATLQAGLAALVAAELLYQRGRPPRARYIFKHALIQDAAYASLLRSTRQHYHRQIAQLLEHRFAETVQMQPELLAHHYTEAGLAEPAITYWQCAAERANTRAANTEAQRHLAKGLQLLATLPESLERHQSELTLQTILGRVLTAAKGYGDAEVAQVYTRARQLCRQIGDTPQIFPVLLGLSIYFVVRGELHTARELGEQLLSLAQREQDPVLLVEAHYALGVTCFWLGEFTLARDYLHKGLPDTIRPSTRRIWRSMARMGDRSASAAWLWSCGISVIQIKPSLKDTPPSPWSRIWIILSVMPMCCSGWPCYTITSGWCRTPRSGQTPPHNSPPGRNFPSGTRWAPPCRDGF